MSKGRIQSVRCKNFVTYESITVEPGINLNVITGPNGAGKSTVVAAILLGMGGNPKLLSRASTIEDYIKNGKQEAWIQIKIYKNDTGSAVTTFERTFNMEKKTEWKIDGKPVSLKDYQAVVSNYNIQIDNLCQFLPQDRVQDFAKQNPQELLLSTQSSVCTEKMAESLDKLKQLRNRQLNGKKNIMDNAKKLKEAETRNAELKEVIDQINEKKECIKKIDHCKAKKAWLHIAELEAKLEQLKGDLEQTEAFYKRDKLNYDQVQQKTVGILRTTEKMNTTINFNKSKSELHSTVIEKMNSSIDELSASIRLKKNELASKQTEENERTAELEHATQVLNVNLQDLQNSIDAKGPEDVYKRTLKSFDDQIEKLKVEIGQLTTRRRKINQHLDDDFSGEIQALRRRIEAMENVSDRKLNFLRDKFSDAYRGVMWLRQNRGQFEGKIYEPMILELNVKDPQFAKYFENTIALRDLLAFTCENRHDLALLSNKLCVEQSLSVNIIHSAPSPGCKFASNEPIEKFRTIGFHSYLLDLIDGPAPILNYLCQIYRIEKILIGDEVANQYTDQLPRQYSLYFIGNQRFQVSYSKYTGQPTQIRNEIREKNLLSITIDQRELDKVKKQYMEKTRQSDVFKNQRTEIEAKATELEVRRTDIQAQKRALELKDMAVKQNRDKLSANKKKVDRIQNNAIDINQETIKFKDFAGGVVKEILSNLEIQVQNIVGYQKSTEEYDFSKHVLHIFKMENSDIEKEVSDSKEAMQKSKNLFETVSAANENTRKNIKSKTIEAKNLCEGKKPSDPDFPLTRIFNKLPKELDTLNELIEELQARVECMTSESASVLAEYEHRLAQIEQLKTSIDDCVNSDQKLDDDLTTLHNEWHPKMRDIVEEINTYFGDFMKSMDYVGQVDLICKEERDYESYGIQIMVQYRNSSKLQALDRYTQSGGERAVAIAVYTLALQHLTHVPFRCVDEINQGMDPRNERKIFEMLVKETSRPGRAQYFFITPKLLSGLQPNEKTTFLIICNAKKNFENGGFLSE